MKPYTNMSHQHGMMCQIPSHGGGGLSPTVVRAWAAMMK